MKSASMALLVAASVAACASTNRERLGDIRLQSYGNPTAFPVVYSVQKDRIVSPQVDLTQDPDGCIRGTVIRGVIEICSKAPPPPLTPGDRVETWSGNGGNFTVEMMEGGKEMRMDGFVRPSSGIDLPMLATVPLGEGPAWDELRKHPAFLAIAAAVAGIRGEPNDQARDAITR
jgi:hypothetical protein